MLLSLSFLHPIKLTSIYYLILPLIDDSLVNFGKTWVFYAYIYGIAQGTFFGFLLFFSLQLVILPYHKGPQYQSGKSGSLGYNLELTIFLIA